MSDENQPEPAAPIDTPLTMKDLDVWGSLEAVPFPLNDPRLHEATRRKQVEVAAAEAARSS